MPFSITSILAPAHLLAFSTLLGTQLYQSFVVTKVAHQALPRPSFISLQKRVFPIYFRTQSLLLVLAVVTSPPYGPLSLLQRKQDIGAFAVASFIALLNLFIFGPRTNQLMTNRAHQGMCQGKVNWLLLTENQATRDAKTHTGSETTSDEMTALNRRFSKAHAMSIHLNLVTIGATLWYGWQLSMRMKHDI